MTLPPPPPPLPGYEFVDPAKEPESRIEADWKYTWYSEAVGDYLSYFGPLTVLNAPLGPAGPFGVGSFYIRPIKTRIVPLTYSYEIVPKSR